MSLHYTACAEGDFSGKAADIWACGVTLYMLTHGKVPFMSANLVQVTRESHVFLGHIYYSGCAESRSICSRQSALHVGQPMSANLVHEYHADSFFRIFIILGLPSHALYADTWQRARHVGQPRASNTGIFCIFSLQISIILGVRSHAVYADTG